MYMSKSMYIYYMHTEAPKGQKSLSDPWNLSFMSLWATMWDLAAESVSCVRTLNC